MEIDGIAFAAIALVVLGVALPAFLHRRQIAAQLRLQERYSEELRILSTTPHMVYAETDEHCVIHTHKPEVRMAERKVTAKALMRERATRRARIARRTARKQRLIMGMAVLLLATIGAWVAVAATTLSMWVPIVLTAGAGAGSWFAFVVTSHMAEANEHDAARIAQIAAMLSRKATPAQRDFEALRASGDGGDGYLGDGGTREVAGAVAGVAVGGVDAAGAGAHNAGMSEAFNAELGVSTEPHKADDVRKVSRSDAGVDGTMQSSRTAWVSAARVRTQMQARPARIEMDPDILRGRAALADPHRSSFEAREPAQMPTYTVKPEVRRVVARRASAFGAMELANQEAEANVPYRPKRIGEQLPGAEQGSHEVNGLAGGSVLDELLKRRRA